MRALILGCGYVGSALGQRLVDDHHEVIGVTRSPDSVRPLEQLGIVPRIADISSAAGARAACEGDADVVVFSVSSRGGDYQKTYVDGLRQTLAALRGQPPRLFIYTGSTSVYAQTDGGWVSEQSPAEPPNPNGRCLLQTERLLAGAAAGEKFAAVVLRLSGIYGPGRHAWLDRLRTGATSLLGVPDQWLNQIHRDDVVAAILHLIHREKITAGLRILNVSDNTPVLRRDYIGWVCEQLGRPIPGSAAAVETAPAHGRERAAANRRISNRALRDLGWAPAYPSFREGLAPLFQGSRA